MEGKRQSAVKSKGSAPLRHCSPPFSLLTVTTIKIKNLLGSANDRAPGRRQSCPQGWRQKSLSLRKPNCFGEHPDTLLEHTDLRLINRAWLCCEDTDPEPCTDCTGKCCHVMGNGAAVNIERNLGGLMYGREGCGLPDTLRGNSGRILREDHFLNAIQNCFCGIGHELLLTLDRQE